jgi:hypothetical protein
MSRYTAIAKLSFEVPAEWFKSKYFFDTPHPIISNVLFQVEVAKDKFIYTVSDGKHMNILTDQGLELVQEKYVESKL